MNRSFARTLKLSAGAVVLCCVASLLTGCSASQFVNGFDNSPIAGTALQGKVHGGQQAVSGAIIQLWAVGSVAYGSAAAPLLGTHVVTTGADGSFNVTGDYTCPAAPSNGTAANVYITASGGNPGLTAGTNNSALTLVAGLGPCASLGSGTVIQINEVTTVATAYALGQYFGTFGTTTDSFGAPNTTQAQVGINNAFATINNLVTTSTGSAVTSATLTGGGFTITTTPESAKLNTIADIIAACVNSKSATDTSGSCPTLFSDVVPTSSTAPTDTLQAAVYMSLNPASNNANGSASNITALFGLASAYAPFVGLSSQPPDWTVGIKYADASTTFLLKPQNVAVDGAGNVWVLSNSSGLGGLSELNPTGTPVVSPATLNVLVGSTNTPFIFTGTSTNPRNIAIDTGNNVWFTASSSATDSNSVKANGAIFEYMTNGGSTGYSTGKGAYGLAIDGSNDIFVSQQSSSAAYELYEFPGGDLTKPVGYPIATATPGTPGVSGANTFIAPEYMAIDTTGNVWMTGGVAASNFAVELTNLASASAIVTSCAGVYPCSPTTSTSSNTYNKVSLGTITGATGLSADTGSMFIADGITGNSVSVVPYATPASESNVGGTTSFTLPKFAATDGAGNVWVSNTNATPLGANPTPGGSISELSGAGAVISPITPDATVTNPGYVHVGLGGGGGIATDPSGNVWVAAAGNSVYELVGAAAPTVTPIATALKNSTVAAKP